MRSFGLFFFCPYFSENDSGLCRPHLPASSFLSQLNEAAVFLIASEQFFVCAAADRSSVKYYDLIGIPDRLEPVRDHDHRLVFSQSIKSGDQLIFIFRIHVCRCLIQDNDRGILVSPVKRYSSSIR